MAQLPHVSAGRCMSTALIAGSTSKDMSDGMDQTLSCLLHAAFRQDLHDGLALQLNLNAAGDFCMYYTIG